MDISFTFWDPIQLKCSSLAPLHSCAKIFFSLGYPNITGMISLASWVCFCFAVLHHVTVALHTCMIIMHATGPIPVSDITGSLKNSE